MPIHRMNTPYRRDVSSYYERSGVMRPSEPWQKSYNVSSTLSLDGIIKWGLIGVAGLFAVYVLVPDAWARIRNGFNCIVFKRGENCDETSTQCPTGYHSEAQCSGMTGLPLILCQTGSWVSGGVFDCVPDTPDSINPTYDEHGCRTDIQFWCGVQNRCMDNALIHDCVYEPPIEPCPSGQHRHVNVWGYPCHDIDSVIPGGDPPWPGAHWCEIDGTWRGSAVQCPTELYRGV